MKNRRKRVSGDWVQLSGVRVSRDVYDRLVMMHRKEGRMGARSSDGRETFTSYVRRILEEYLWEREYIVRRRGSLQDLDSGWEDMD